MAQYIVRRELKEANAETSLSDNLKCMLLLLFSGLDLKEQQGILASVNNKYDYKKVSHGFRIQFPNVQSTRAVPRKDYLGVGRGSGQQQLKPRWKPFQRKQQVLAAEDDGDEVYDDEEAVAEEDTFEYEATEDDGYVAYSDDEALEALIGELPDEGLENGGEIADALATLAQHRSGFKKKFIKKPSQGPSPQGSQQTFPFKAQGDLSFDQRSKDQRKAAVNFLKTVTACTACGAKGHWVGDSVCPKSSKKGAGRGRGKGSSSKSPRRPAPCEWRDFKECPGF